jgi:hypothetical protein
MTGQEAGKITASASRRHTICPCRPVSHHFCLSACGLGLANAAGASTAARQPRKSLCRPVIPEVGPDHLIAAKGRLAQIGRACLERRIVAVERLLRAFFAADDGVEHAEQANE